MALVATAAEWDDDSDPDPVDIVLGDEDEPIFTSHDVIEIIIDGDDVTYRPPLPYSE